MLRSLREASARPRLLLALKTALAVGIAWFIAPHMPGVTEQYPYYAPLGALVSMSSTLMGSAKTGLQTLLGLVAGILLAALVVVTVGPTWWSIPLVVGVGVVLSGTGWFGAGSSYVSTAALFVLIIGGRNAEGYSLGYLVQMGVGVVVGLAVNFLVAPAITTLSAAARVDAFQKQLATHLHDIGYALEETWPPQHAEWSRNAESLAETATAVRQTLAEGDESRKGNPRTLFQKHDVEKDFRRLEMLDTVVFHLRDISGGLADNIWGRPGAFTFDEALVTPLSAACHRVADVLELQDPAAAEAHRALGLAARAVRELVVVVDARTLDDGTAMGPGVLCAMHLRRILMYLQEQVGAQAERAAR